MMKENNFVTLFAHPFPTISTHLLFVWISVPVVFHAFTNFVSTQKRTKSFLHFSRRSSFLTRISFFFLKLGVQLSLFIASSFLLQLRYRLSKKAQSKTVLSFAFLPYNVSLSRNIEISEIIQANRKKPRMNNNEKTRQILTLVSIVFSPLFSHNATSMLFESNSLYRLRLQFFST